MTDWMTIRVVLQGGVGTTLAHPPGRIMLTSAEHTFSDLAEAVDTAFGRWDLTPSHEFEVEGRLLRPGGAPEEDDRTGLEPGDSAEVTVGEVGLRVGASFAYRFDPGEDWLHECTVEETGVDAFAVAGEEPDMPVPVFGWGPLPDQYGRLTEEDDEDGEEQADSYEFDDDEEEVEADLELWRAVEESSWGVVEEALDDVDRNLDRQELTAAARRLRAGQDDPELEVLFAAAGLDLDDLPESDEELWLELASAVVAPRDEPPLDPETAAAWSALEPADWAGAVIELVRGGVGEQGDPDALLELIAQCPEIEGEELTEDDEEVLLSGLSVVVGLWRTLGALDGDEQLTALGRWGLPESLKRAWTTTQRLE